ncbi:MAG: hypothetical protein ABIJ81_03105 [Patescibacteria group bacterium]
MLIWLQSINWQRFFTSRAPEFQPEVFKIVLGAVIALVVFGIICKIFAAVVKLGPWKKLFRRLGNLFITIGLLAALSIFFTQTATPLLGARWWFLLWLVIAIVWLVFILRYACWQMPKQLKKGRDLHEFSKYLPRKSN